MIKDDITGQPLVVSNRSTSVIVYALTAAHREGVITHHQYKMTYAEVCEIGRLPQAFGGGPVDPEAMEDWKNRKSWE